MMTDRKRLFFWLPKNHSKGILLACVLRAGRHEMHLDIRKRGTR
jgi:hypothetical protein